MAKIKLKDPNAKLRGVFGGFMFKVINGEQYVFAQRTYEYSKDDPPATREAFRRHDVINTAIKNIQLHYSKDAFTQADTKAIQEQMNKYGTYYAYAFRKYNEWHKMTKSDGKLEQGIVESYIYGTTPKFVKPKNKK